MSGRDPSREGLGDSPARIRARLSTHYRVARIRQAARRWPHWQSMPKSRRMALNAILDEAESRGWTEFPLAERYLITVLIRHHGRGCSPATAHRILSDLREAGWLTLRREGCKAARLARRWALSPAAPPRRPAPAHCPRARAHAARAGHHRRGHAGSQRITSLPAGWPLRCGAAIAGSCAPPRSPVTAWSSPPRHACPADTVRAACGQHQGTSRSGSPVAPADPADTA